MSTRLETFVTSPFFLFRFSYPGSQVFCFYPGNLIYSSVFPSFLSPLCHHFLFPPELLKSTEFAASSPSSFLLQSDLQTTVLLLFIKRFFLVFIILRIKFEYPQLLLKFIYIFLSSSVLFNGLF